MSTAKRVKTALIVALTVAMMAGVPALAQFSGAPPPIQSYEGDPGQLGDPASWRTPEFLRDNGMISIGAEFAYAAGYAGGGMNIGIVDSGFFAGHMREHGSLATNYAIGDRYHSVEAQGGVTGPTPGFYDPTFNDSHGTHVSGTVGASRDGVGETQPTGPVANMHGVAFNADVYLGNTHKTDGVFYGHLPATATAAQTPDNAYLANVYRAVNSAVTANGRPIRLITSSWGSQPNTENYNTYDTPPGSPASFGLNAAWRYLSTPDGVADPNGNTVHWLNGAIEVARTGTIVQFTAGNSGYDNPTPRGAAPYFLPELEGRWYTTSGINPGIGRTFNADGSVLVPGQQEFNRCGVAKWSCLTAPSRSINSTTVQVVNGVPQPRYGSSSGTSMAGPHSAAVLALVMQRFPYLTNTQALYTMFTTARQNNTISDATGAAVSNPTRGEMVQVPDRRNGWNTPNLRDAFKGPGQLLGPFDLDTQGYDDVWSNDISDVAIQARQQEDADEAAAWEATKVARGWTQRPACRRDRHRQVGLRHRHTPRAGAQRARVRGQPHEARQRNPVPHRQRHVARQQHRPRRQALGRRLARELDRRRRRHARRQRHRRRQHRRRRRRAAARSHAGEEAEIIDASPPATSSTSAGTSPSPGRRRRRDGQERDDYTSVAGRRRPGAGRGAHPRRAGSPGQGDRADDHERQVDRGHVPQPPREGALPGGHLFRVSYENDKVTLTVMQAVPPNA